MENGLLEGVWVSVVNDRNGRDTCGLRSHVRDTPQDWLNSRWRGSGLGDGLIAPYASAAGCRHCLTGPLRLGRESLSL